MKECKEPCVTNNQGPDIIPEKSFFQERSETTVKTCDSEDDTNLSSVQNDPNTRKYGEYQSVTFTEDPELISTPKKLRLLQEIEGDVEESGITVETPLISSIPAAVQQWTDHRKEGMRLSTPV
ncbi:uncharacterized protein TNCT_584701 [Trichonephila clavata]|uniref:Uncharacterized protein n=1 Tax=Trichonephila clavata TaxID=2740835 RepID=A0A8X6I5W3_TRICU|nr:uncharacterized protein TNCT_584701 [Trichonephila clavata]